MKNTVRGKVSDPQNSVRQSNKKLRLKHNDVTLSQTLSPINLKPQAESSINRSFNKTFVVPLNYNMNISSAKDLPKEKKRPKAKGKSKLEGIKERK